MSNRIRHIVHVVGARPNFMKVAPIVEAIEAAGSIRQTLVHTGQHYSPEMSALFFDELGLPEPDVNLEVGSGPHGQQTGRIMEAFEGLLADLEPDAVLVVGDVNSTIACALDAAKLGIAVVHVEAGLRSFDRAMPEEINRVLTDAISDLLFITEESAADNLAREGVSADRVHFVGNVMIDSLLKHREAALARPVLGTLGLDSAGYTLVTMHRPSNVDDPDRLRGIGEALRHIGASQPVVFPMHPRTRANVDRFDLGGLFGSIEQLRILEPQGYLDFLNLTANAHAVLTDSGGIQEETTILGVPCLTARENTERPVTISHGTNRLVEPSQASIIEAWDAVKPPDDATAPPLWDGQAARRIAEVLGSY